MKFEWFVARRYLRSPYRPTVLRLVTAFSIIGVAAGVATLIIALAMNTGFRETLQDRLLGVTAHVSLTRPGAGGILDYKVMASKLAAIPGVRSVTSAAYQTVLMTFAGAARGVVTKGIDLESERRSDEALQHIIAGTLDFSPDRDGIDAIVIGKQLAQEWKLSPGDYVTLTSPQGGRLTPFGMLPRSRRFRVAAVFDSGFYDYDENWCFLSLPAAQGLSGVGDRVSVLEFRLHKPEQAAQIARALEQAAGSGYAATTFSRVAPGKVGDRDFHRTDYVRGRAEHPCRAIDDGNRQSARRRGADVHGLQSAANPAHFSLAGDCHRRDGDVIRIVHRICLGLDRRVLSRDPAGPASVRSAIRTVSPKPCGWVVDRDRRDGYFFGGNPDPREGCGAPLTGGNPTL